MKSPSILTFAAVLLASSAALAQSTLDQIEALPFMKAYSYAKAAEEFCFIDKKEDAAAVSLAIEATEQEDALGEPGALFKEYQKAVAHLSRDQSACQPAIDFVDRTVANLTEHLRQFDQLVDEQEAQERQEAREKRKQKLAAKKAAREAAAALKVEEEKAAAKKAAEEAISQRQRICGPLKSLVEAGPKGDAVTRRGLIELWQVRIADCQSIYGVPETERLQKVLRAFADQ